MPEKHVSDPRSVVVAMSGGVDSSVAAALLKSRGIEVFGVTLDLFEAAGDGENGKGAARWAKAAEDFEAGEEGKGADDRRNCRGGESAGMSEGRAERDAAGVAAGLGIPHSVVRFRRRFERTVIANFVEEYGRGRTPNPCLRCNRFVKLGPLVDRAARMGAEKVATGHYARVDFDEGSGRWRLRKGVDPAKDQSYFLYALSQEILARSVFPLGELRKEEVRALARRFGLPVAEKPESQEICFVPGDDYAAFLRGRIPRAFRPGKIVDLAGKVIGRHGGFLSFTVGQRKGMGIASPRPLYVVAVDAATNTVVAGPDEALFQSRLVVSGVNWVAIAGIDGSRRAEVKIRSRHEGAPATLRPGRGRTVVVDFDRPQRAITPGQAAVFYEGDVVLGGGLIS